MKDRTGYLIIIAIAALLILLLWSTASTGPQVAASTCPPQTWQTRETIHRGLVIWLNRRDRQEREP